MVTHFRSSVSTNDIARTRYQLRRHWQRAVYWKLAPARYKCCLVKGGTPFNLDLLIMPRSYEASSTKSSTLSGKASSVKKAVKKGVKAATQPFKKLKQALSVTSISRSTHSRSSTVRSNDADNINNISDGDRASVENGDSGPEVELTPEQELSMCLLH